MGGCCGKKRKIPIAELERAHGGDMGDAIPNPMPENAETATVVGTQSSATPKLRPETATTAPRETTPTESAPRIGRAEI